jgi:ATP-dependent DNA helicase
VQTISLIALLREQENYLGPHLIVAPLSTLSNWINEFNMWTPSIPVIMYHGTPKERKELFEKSIRKNLKNGRPTDRFPVVCTSYEIILKDRVDLAKINWEFIIIVGLAHTATCCLTYSSVVTGRGSSNEEL